MKILATALSAVNVLPRDAMHSVTRCLSVRPSVCHTPVFCWSSSDQLYSPNVDIGLQHLEKISSNFYQGSHAIPIFCTKRCPPNGGLECKGVRKIAISTNISLYLGNYTRQTHRYYERRIGNRTKLSNGAIFNYLERPLSQILMSRHYSTLNICETVRNTDIVATKY